MPSIPELSAAVAIAVSIGGALFALRRQGDLQLVSSGRDLQSRITELESTNRYLVSEMARLQRDNTRMAEQLSLVAEELRDWKRRYERQMEENNALTIALGARQ